MLKRVFFSHRVAGHKRTVPRSSRKEKRTQPKSRHIFTKTTTWYIRSHTSQTRMKTTTMTTTTYVTPQRPSLMAWNGLKLFLLSFQLLTNNVEVNHSITKVVKGCTFRILDQIPTRVGNGKRPLEASTRQKLQRKLLEIFSPYFGVSALLIWWWGFKFLFRFY